MKSNYNYFVFILLIILVFLLVFLLIYLARSVNENYVSNIEHTKEEIESNINDVLDTTNTILTDISNTHLNFT